MKASLLLLALTLPPLAGFLVARYLNPTPWSACSRSCAAASKGPESGCAWCSCS